MKTGISMSYDMWDSRDCEKSAVLLYANLKCVNLKKYNIKILIKSHFMQKIKIQVLNFIFIYLYYT